MSAVRAGRRTFACRAAGSMDLPKPIAFPADHRPARRDPHPLIAPAGIGTGDGRWPHALSHRGCAATAADPPIATQLRRWAER